MNGTIPQPAPFVPGHEGAGIIAAVGEGVTDLEVGDHVIVAWCPPCGKCNNCVERNQPHLCVDDPVRHGRHAPLHRSTASRCSAWPAPAPSPST